MANKRQIETDEFLKMVTRMIRAAAVRVGNGDEIQLAAFNQVQTAMKDAMKDAIHQQLDQGKSWSDIASGLGTSKQNAFQRWGK
jgi:hypothetical protein